jgi:hypothetical protein
MTRAAPRTIRPTEIRVYSRGFRTCSVVIPQPRFRTSADVEKVTAGLASSPSPLWVGRNTPVVPVYAATIEDPREPGPAKRGLSPPGAQARLGSTACSRHGDEPEGARDVDPLLRLRGCGPARWCDCGLATSTVRG